MNSFEKWWPGVERGLIAAGDDNPQVLAALKAVANSAWAACEQQFRSQWRPIETAPKGTYSLHKDDPEWVDPPRTLLSTPGGVVIAYWDYYFDGSVGGHGYQGNETAWVGDDGELVEDVFDMPTHWMPLPEAPQGDEK